MTEKRFEVECDCGYDESLLRDVETGELMHMLDCQRVLNEQHKEIERLENKLGRARNRIRRQSKDLDKYLDYFRRELNWDCDRIIEEGFK